MWRWLGLLASALLAACAEVPPQRVPEPVVEVAPEAPPPPPADDGWYKGPLKHLAGRDLKPMPVRPLNVRSRCSHKDAVGTVTRLDLLVREAEVKRLDARVSIKGKGACSFNLKNFEQVEKMPQPLLRARDGSACTLRLWEQEKRVTLAFNSCAQACERDAFSYLWPIMVESKSGQCF